MKARLSLGIDLGTSNCAMALTDLETDRTEVLPIPQILAANQFGEKPTLASATYLPHPEEFPPGSFAPALERWRRAGDHRAVRPRPRRPRAGPSGDLRQVLAVQPAHRPEAARAALAVRQRGREAFAVRVLAPLPAASQGRFPPHRRLPGQALGPRRRPDRRDRPRLLRRGGAQPDGRSGRGRRTGPRHVAGGTAGRLLRVVRAGRPAMARCGGAWRRHPGVRRRRRHRRFQLDRSGRCRRRPGAGAYQRRRTHPPRRRQHGSRPRLHAAGRIGSRRQSAGCLAVPGARACRIAREDHLVRGRHLAGGADRDPVARLQPVRQDDRHGARSRLALAGHPRRVLRPDRGRRSSARSAPGRAAGIRPALRIRSGDQQAFGPLPHAQPAECEGERQAGRSGRSRGPAGKR